MECSSFHFCFPIFLVTEMKVASIKSDIEHATNGIAVSLYNAYEWLQKCMDEEI